MGEGSYQTHPPPNFLNPLPPMLPIWHLEFSYKKGFSSKEKNMLHHHDHVSTMSMLSTMSHHHVISNERDKTLCVYYMYVLYVYCVLYPINCLNHLNYILC